MEDKICRFCGEKLDPKALGKIFCGRSCHNGYQTAKKEEGYITKKCGHCRKEYKTTDSDQQYCSVKCFHGFLNNRSYNRKRNGEDISQKEWDDCLNKFK